MVFITRRAAARMRANACECVRMRANACARALSPLPRTFFAALAFFFCSFFSRWANLTNGSSSLSELLLELLLEEESLLDSASSPFALASAAYSRTRRRGV